MIMTDKDKIKFAIRYLKKGLKSKRTPPLYEELMNELGFVKKDKVNNLISVAEVRLANWQKYEKENKELLCQKNRNKSCYSCANATERCFRNEIGCPCQKYKSYKEENAELEKAYNETEELLDKQIEATYNVVL